MGGINNEPGNGVDRGSLRGFTLIELSIVLVIIGLIVGGVLTGQSLIAAAAVRAQINQIEKFNRAANTFYGKYGYLPGDIPAIPAAQFGFAARGLCPGEGDGNGLIQGISSSCPAAGGSFVTGGEAAMFWLDLSTVNLIEENFNTASSSTIPDTNIPQNNVANYMPAASIERNNYVYVWTGGNVTNTGGSSLRNMFGIAAMSGLIQWGAPQSNAGLTVAEAYAIDSKIDDSLPLSGRVQTVFVTYDGSATVAAAPTGVSGVYGTSQASAIPGSATSCYDNNNSAGVAVKYSISQNNGSGVNCPLSFRMQAGD